MPPALSDLVGEATGRRHRPDPVAGITGGPAGNARLTAWTGIVVLALVLAELATLLDVSGLISWHVVLGTLLVPVALLKTASTSWRVGRYYTGRRTYVTAGPPPTPLRLLGPLVVLSTLGLLGSGLALIALGPQAGKRPFVTILGFSLDTLTLHQALFIVFAVVTGLHLLARIVPAVQLISGRINDVARVRGGVWRLATIFTALVVAAITAALVLGAAGTWRHDGDSRHHGLPRTTTRAR